MWSINDYRIPYPNLKKKKLDIKIIKIHLTNIPKESHIDLTSQFPSTRCQGMTNSCVAFAVTGAMEFIMNQFKSLNNKILSEEYLYNECIKFEKLHEHSEIGTHISIALHIATEKGICTEEAYKNNNLLDATNYRIKSYGCLHELIIGNFVNKETKIAIIRKSLSINIPIIISFKESCNPFHSLYSRLTGYIINSSNMTSIRHCVIIVGYNDENKTFKFRNSRDSKYFHWGDNGYGYINYNDVNIITQGWIITGINILDKIDILRYQFMNSSQDDNLEMI
jgi:C1A family cysteine protease